MEKKDMKMAGWACIISAVTTLPIFILTLLAALSEVQSVGVILSFISLALFVYIFHSLRRLLIERFDFNLVNTHITIMIWTSVAGTFISAVVVSIPDVVLGILASVAVVALGIVLIAFAITLLKLEDSLDGLLKPFCYLSIAQGVCTASIILIPLGLLISIAVDILLALIFFHTADRVSATSEKNTEGSAVFK